MLASISMSLRSMSRLLNLIPNLLNLMNKLFITLVVIISVFTFMALSILGSAVMFNNTMIKLDETKKGKLEGIKTSYSQCIVKITEVNSIAIAYKNDLVEMSKAAGSNLQAFSEQAMTWFNTKIMPEVSPELRLSVQREIVSCRNEFSAGVKFDLVPLYITFNQNIRQFPNNLYNLFFQWKTEDLKMPQESSVIKQFDTGVVNSIELK